MQSAIVLKARRRRLSALASIGIDASSAANSNSALSGKPKVMLFQRQAITQVTSSYLNSRTPVRLAA